MAREAADIGGKRHAENWTHFSLLLLPTSRPLPEPPVALCHIDARARRAAVTAVARVRACIPHAAGCLA